MFNPNGPVPITGIPLPDEPDQDHPIPCRLNIEHWYHDSKNGLQVSLFIQALHKFQVMPYEDQLSYFRIAGKLIPELIVEKKNCLTLNSWLGIHGYPKNVPWNMDQKPGEGEGYYCAHNKVTFATWHRPYLLLFEVRSLLCNQSGIESYFSLERRLYDIMIEEIVNPMPDGQEKQLWKIAAQTWRLPYWDWASNSNVPELLTKELLEIVESASIVGGVKIRKVHNPLWKFSMNTGKPMGDESHGPYKIEPDESFPVSLMLKL